MDRAWLDTAASAREERQPGKLAQRSQQRWDGVLASADPAHADPPTRFPTEGGKLGLDPESSLVNTASGRELRERENRRTGRGKGLTTKTPACTPITGTPLRRYADPPIRFSSRACKLFGLHIKLQIIQFSING